jgi:hypothetical protein
MRLVVHFCGFVGCGRLFDGAQVSTLLHQGLEVLDRHLVHRAVDLGLAVLVLEGLLRLAEGAALELLHRP